LRDNLIQIFNEIVEYYAYKGAGDITTESEKALILLKRKYDETFELVSELKDDNNYLKEENADLKDQVEFLKEQLEHNISSMGGRKSALEISSFAYPSFNTVKSVF
jgi:hypothetical protein